MTKLDNIFLDGDNEDDFAPDLSNYNMLVAGEIAAANGLVAAALFQVEAKVLTHPWVHVFPGSKPTDCVCRGS